MGLLYFSGTIRDSSGDHMCYNLPSTTSQRRSKKHRVANRFEWIWMEGGSFYLAINEATKKLSRPLYF